MLLLPAALRQEELSLVTLRRAVAASWICSAIAMATLVLLLPDTAIGHCRVDKCGTMAATFVDPGVGNSLGMRLVVIAIFLPWPSFAKSLLAMSGMLGILLLLGSRSSLYALVILFIFIASRRLSRLPHRFVYVLTLLATLTGSLYTAFSSLDPSSYTGRAILWYHARDLIAASPLFGYGPSFWVRQAITSNLDANYSVHNVWLENLVEVGIAGTVVMILALGFSCRRYSDRRMAPWFFPIILALGTTEAPLMAGRTNLEPAVVLIFFLATYLTEGPSSSPQSCPPVLLGRPQAVPLLGGT